MLKAPSVSAEIFILRRMNSNTSEFILTAQIPACWLTWLVWLFLLNTVNNFSTRLISSMVGEIFCCAQSSVSATTVISKRLAIIGGAIIFLLESGWEDYTPACVSDGMQAEQQCWRHSGEIALFLHFFLLQC